jgi:hypothetical protein
MVYTFATGTPLTLITKNKTNKKHTQKTTYIEVKLCTFSLDYVSQTVDIW